MRATDRPLRGGTSALLTLGIVGALLVVACSGADDRSDSAASDASILSAYLGVIDVPVLGVALLEGVSGCDQEPRDDGMPIVLSHQIDAATLDASDFEVTTASGDTTTPTCATLEPATDPDELQTVLLTGPLGSDDDRPTRLEIVDEVLTVDGTDLTGLEIDEISTLDDGPEIVLARLDPAGATCAELGSTHEIQTTWQGGVTGPTGSVPGDEQLAGLSITDADGGTFALLGFDDLGDGDNYVVVCVPAGVTPVGIEALPGTLFDPTNNPNPATSADVEERQ